MPKTKTHTEEQLIANHRASALKWSRANAEKRRAKAKEYHAANKDRINARRRELQLAKKNTCLKKHLKETDDININQQTQEFQI